MRGLLLVPFLLAAAPAIAAQRSFPATGFDKVNLAAAAAVDIHTGTGFAVRAEGDQRLLDRLDVGVRNGTLVIGWRPGTTGTLHGRNQLRIAISMPAISGATISGAGSVSVDRVQARDFAATVGGAGTLRLPALHTGHATLTVNGAGDIVAAGSAGQVEARVGGFGSVDAAALAAKAGRFTMSGTGSIKARVDGPAEVSMSGVGSVHVLGTPRCTIHKGGLGSVHCGA